MKKILLLSAIFLASCSPDKDMIKQYLSENPEYNIEVVSVEGRDSVFTPFNVNLSYMYFYEKAVNEYRLLEQEQRFERPYSKPWMEYYDKMRSIYNDIFEKWKNYHAVVREREVNRNSIKAKCKENGQEKILHFVLNPDGQSIGHILEKQDFDVPML